MSVETKEELLEKLDQSRRLLRQVPDPETTETVRAYVEELEAKLLMMMSHGPKD